MSIGSGKIALSIEQALSMSYATLRLVHEGFRVIRLEPVVEDFGEPSKKMTPGDPNRYIGRPVAGQDRQSYFVGPNVGKEAIALNLKRDEGRSLLHRLVRELPVDIVCTNVLPSRHERLGLDYETLSTAHAGGEARQSLIWCSISAFGPSRPDVVGYDPVLQALCGYMDLNGDPDGPPMLCGLPLVDLKAGDEAFTQILIALVEQAQTGEGKRIDISMAQAALSWLQTVLPLLDMESPPEELRRRGNQHRLFVPVNVFPALDGHLFVAVGSDIQWRRLVAHEAFAALDLPHYATNEGRRERRDELNEALGQRTSRLSCSELATVLTVASIPHAPITPIEAVPSLPEAAPFMLHTSTPEGRTVHLPPPAVMTGHLGDSDGHLGFCPGYGEHTKQILGEIGVTSDQFEELEKTNVVV